MTKKSDENSEKTKSQEKKLEVKIKVVERENVIEEKIGFLGSGNMMEALTGGLIAKKVSGSDMIFSSNPSIGKLKKMEEKFGITTFAGPGSNAEVVKRCKVIVLSVKPVYVENVLKEIKSHLTDEHVILSIAAGVQISTIQDIIGPKARVARLAVNTPALVGAGAGGYAMGPGCHESDSKVVSTFMKSVGIAHELEERLIDSVTGLAGSGPAFVFMFIEALADGGVKEGIPRPVALQLAAQTVYGASKMVMDTGIHPAQLKDNVASPGGTTIDGIHKLEELGFRSSTISAVSAAVEKGRLMGQKK